MRLCIRSQKGCETSLLCSLFGRCNLQGGECIAHQASSCEKSKNCRDHRACLFDPLTSSCLTLPPPLSCEKACQLQGKCTLQTLKKQSPNSPNQRCVSRSNEECRQSEICKKYGQCTAVNGRCIASRHQDCQQGIQCRLFGYCRASLGRCIR